MSCTGDREIKGGQMTVSTPWQGESSKLSLIAEARATASLTTVFIFQLPTARY